MELVVEQNVRQTVADIRRKSKVLAKMEKDGEIEIVGAIYSLQTGAVSLIEQAGHRNSNTGTWTSGAVWSSNTSPINFANPYAMEFDGADDFINFSNPGTLNNLGTLTYSVWMAGWSKCRKWLN